MRKASCFIRSFHCSLKQVARNSGDPKLYVRRTSNKMAGSFETEVKCCNEAIETTPSRNGEQRMNSSQHELNTSSTSIASDSSPGDSRNYSGGFNSSGNPKRNRKSPGMYGNKKSPGSRLSLTPEKEETWAMDLLERSRGYNHRFIDSHCHIDLIYNRLGLAKTSVYTDFRDSNAKSYPANYEGCVAIFCSPETFDLQDPQDAVLNRVLTEPGVWLALGCHPKNATNFKSTSIEGLRKKLCSLPNVVALGEIGLDYSGEFHKLADIQREVLISQLQLAVELNLPLVIHCRDADDELLEILQNHVPYQHKIHRHCFTQDLATAQRWMDAFPNMFIGFTPVISYKSAQDPASAASQIPLDRLLLETDAPYFVPANVKDRRVKITHPGFALFTAEKIAELRGISVDEVLEACRNNTSRMYGI